MSRANSTAVSRTSALEVVVSMPFSLLYSDVTETPISPGRV